jgi:rRNA-processing protein FCF1
MASNRIWGDRSEQIIIFDTNAILMLFEFNIDLDNELKRLIGKYKIVIPKQVKDELIRFSEKTNGEKKIHSKASLKLIKEFEIIDNCEKDADSAVLFLAKKTNGIVLTNDKKLRKILKENSILTMFLRAKKTLELK